MPSTPVTEAIGQSVIATAVPLEADGVTTTPEAVVSDQSWSISPTTGVANLTVNGDGTATFVATGSGTASVTVTATVTDANGTVSTLSASNVLTVTAPTGTTAGLQINFGTPA